MITKNLFGYCGFPGSANDKRKLRESGFFDIVSTNYARQVVPPGAVCNLA